MKTRAKRIHAKILLNEDSKTKHHWSLVDMNDRFVLLPRANYFPKQCGGVTIQMWLQQ